MKPGKHRVARTITESGKYCASPTRVAVIGTQGVPARYGGFETLVDRLVRHNDSRILQYTVFCSTPAYEDRPATYHNARLRYVPLKANGIQSIPYDILSLLRATRSSDAVLVLGVSGCAFLPAYRLFSKKKLVINIDGLEHRRAKWKPWVRKFLKFSEKMAVKYADVIITDNKGITDYVSREYGLESVSIAYGGDHVDTEVPDKEKHSILSRYGLEAGGYDIALCRIEPENNVETILEAYSGMPARRLLFIGNWSHSPYGRWLLDKYSHFTNIVMHEAVYDLPTLHTLRSECAVYVHGHSAGGTNPSLVEAMFFGKPIAVFDCVYNRETTENKAFYFDSSQSLRDTVCGLETTEAYRSAAAMVEIAHRRYTWDYIASRYEALFTA